MIKTFENFGDNIIDDSPYKKGDYILFYDDDIQIENTGIIMGMYVNRSEVWYEVRNTADDTLNGEIYIRDISVSDINRLLTPEEIENIKLKKETDKYNL